MARAFIWVQVQELPFFFFFFFWRQCKKDPSLVVLAQTDAMSTPSCVAFQRAFLPRAHEYRPKVVMSKPMPTILFCDDGDFPECAWCGDLDMPGPLLRVMWKWCGDVLQRRLVSIDRCERCAMIKAAEDAYAAEDSD